MDNLLCAVISSVVTNIIWMVLHNWDVKELMELITLMQDIIRKQQDLISIYEGDGDQDG